MKMSAMKISRGSNGTIVIPNSYMLGCVDLPGSKGKKKGFSKSKFKNSQ